MKYLANIVSMKPVETPEFVNVLTDINEIDINLPTLIIGYNDIIKANFDSESISLIDRYIDHNTMWTFSKYERANDYNKDLTEFNNEIFEELDLTVNYEYFNLLTRTLTEKKDFINYLKSYVKKYLYLCEDTMIYVHFGNNIVGISIDDIEFFNIGKEKIKNWLEKLPNIKIIQNDKFLTYKTQKYIKNKRHLVPLLYKLKYNS